MDDSVGSSSISLPPLTSGYPAQLENLHVTIPCKTSSDALIASLSVALSEDLSSTVIDAFLQLFQDPAFCSKEVTFQAAQDISKHISEQRKRIAHKRSLAVQRSLSSRKTSPYGSEVTSVYGVVPQVIVDMVAQQLASEMDPFSQQVDKDTTLCNFNENRCPREQDLQNMTLVHRTWTTPAVRALRPRVKIVGSRNLQAFLRSPRMGPWIREFYFVESLESENAREMMFLLEYFVHNTSNLRKLAIRTWWRIGTPNTNDLDGVVRELAHMRELESLWLFTNRGHIGCLPTLVATLPHMRSLKKLHLRNWMVGHGNENTVNTMLRSLISTTTSGARLTTLSFVDGAVSDTSAIFLPWLLKDSPLVNLELHTKDLFWHDTGGPSPMFHALRPFLSKLRTLRLHYSSLNDSMDCRTEFIRSCTNVKNFSMVVGLHHELNELPESTENLHVHFSTIWPVNGRRLADVVEPQELERLRTIRLTKDPMDAFVIEAGAGVGDEGHPEALEVSFNVGDIERICEDRHVEFTREYGFLSFEQLSAL